jgi:hypothetical protein
VFGFVLDDCPVSLFCGRELTLLQCGNGSLDRGYIAVTYCRWPEHCGLYNVELIEPARGRFCPANYRNVQMR